MTEPVRERETTVVTTDGGGGGVILAVVLILAVLALLYFLFSGSFNRAADEVGVNVNVEAPKIEVPDNIELKLPEDVDVTTDGGGNKSK